VRQEVWTRVGSQVRSSGVPGSQSRRHQRDVGDVGEVSEMQTCRKPRVPLQQGQQRMKTCHWRDLKLSSVKLLVTCPTACVARCDHNLWFYHCSHLCIFFKTHHGEASSTCVTCLGTCVISVFLWLMGFDGRVEWNGVCFGLIRHVCFYTSSMKFWTLYRPHARNGYAEHIYLT
jgi:hypothetical protein